MALKHQEFFTDEHTRTIACNTLASLLAESLAELGYECLASCLDIGEGYARLGYRCDKRSPQHEDLEEVATYLGRLTRLEVELTSIDSGASVPELLRAARVSMKTLLRKRLHPLAMAPNEYALLVTWWGGGVVIEGFRERVYMIGSYAATAHTHPSGICLPSHHDVDSIARLLADGGCCAGVVSATCMLLVARRGPLTLEDYDGLLELGKRLARVKSLGEALEELGRRASRLKSVHVELVSL